MKMAPQESQCHNHFHNQDQSNSHGPITGHGHDHGHLCPPPHNNHPSDHHDDKLWPYIMVTSRATTIMVMIKNLPL